MSKVTTVFMDKKESTDLYPPTLKGTCFFILIVALTVFVFAKLHKVTSQEITESVSVPGYGNVQGLIKKAFHGPYASFLAIPFAQAPIGPLRFKKPQELSSFSDWSNRTIIAKEFAPSCYNLKKTNGSFIQTYPESEDCLYLNIFVPLSKELKMPLKPLPVMVWIHGGGFIFGSAHRYLPEELVTSQSVIVVTIQYRLAILGFAQTTDPNEIPGNMGLYDQVMALKWIKNNIAHFGGNDNSITLFGESAGSISVGFHLISKQSIGLFNRAILQSGAPLTMMQVGTESVPLWMEKVAIELRCPIKARKLSKAKYATFKEETYKCLRDAPVQKLREIEFNLIFSKKSTGFLPATDHETGFFGDHPMELLKSENDPFVSNVTEILLGHNGGEGTMFMSIWLPDLFPKKTALPGNLSYELIREKIMQKVPDQKDKIEMIFKAIIDDVNPSQRKNISQIANKFNTYLGDAGFYCPNLHFMDSFLKKDTRKAYYYLFNARSERDAKTKFIWSEKAIHAEEIQFVFGFPFSKKEWKNYTSNERQLSLTMMKDWASFAESGSPRGDQWKACQDEEERNYMLYENNFIEPKSGLPENQCSEYFESTYEEIVNRYKYMDNI